MKIALLFSTIFFLFFGQKTERIIQYDGQDIRTTYSVPDKFIGHYSGRKSGYLKLAADGTGEYSYDVFGYAPASCKKQVIKLEWGLMLEKNSTNIVSLNREYGKSYPILLKSISETQFQGCRTPVMLDFIMEFKNGQLGISSSDDWIKQ